jgi:hypothetical protein
VSRGGHKDLVFDCYCTAEPGEQPLIAGRPTGTHTFTFPRCLPVHSHVEAIPCQDTMRFTLALVCVALAFAAASAADIDVNGLHAKLAAVDPRCAHEPGVWPRDLLRVHA